MAAKTPSPPSRKDEILALLEAHGIAVEVHTNREPEYARDFRDGEFVLIGRNPHEGGRIELVNWDPRRNVVFRW